MFNFQDYQMWYLMLVWLVVACIGGAFVGNFIKRGHGFIRIKRDKK